MNKVETVYRTETFKIGNVTVNIHHPILTDTERKRVEADIVSALGRFGKVIEGVKNNVQS